MEAAAVRAEALGAEPPTVMGGSVAEPEPLPEPMEAITAGPAEESTP